jgi:hypothetical protein
MRQIKGKKFMRILIDEEARKHIIKKGGDVKITFQSFHSAGG